MEDGFVLTLDHVSEFKYLECVLDETGTYGTECSTKLASGERIAFVNGFIVNARDFQLECVKALYETLLVPILIYGSEITLWKEKEKSGIRAVQMDSLKGLIGIRSMDRAPNARIRELCGVMKGLDERIDEGVLWWFAHVERMDRDIIAKRVYVGESADSRSVGRPSKRWSDTVKPFAALVYTLIVSLRPNS